MVVLLLCSLPTGITEEARKINLNEDTRAAKSKFENRPKTAWIARTNDHCQSRLNLRSLLQETPPR